MSLINQMLQDLDKRGSTVGVVIGPTGTDALSQNHIRTVPNVDNKSRRIWWVAALLLLLIAIVIGAVWGLRYWQKASPAAAIVKPAASGQAIKATPLPAPALTILPATPAIPAIPTAPDALPTDVSPAGTSEIKPALTSPSEVLPVKPLPAPMSIGKSTANDPTKNDETKSITNNNTDIAGRIANTLNADANASTILNATPVLRSTQNDVKAIPRNNTKKKGKADSENDGKIAPQAKEVTPQQAIDNHYRKAVTLIDVGQISQAIDMLQQVLQLDPKHAAARQTLVGLLLDTKHQDDAMRKLQEGIAIDPAQTGMAMILARLQVERGNTRTALETLERSLSYALADADYQAFLAALLQREKRHKEAIDHYAIAIRKMPENGLWWMGYGISLQAENRLPEAKDAFTRAKSSSTLSPELRTFVDQKLSQMPR
ncbi:tetratricopeptide repeat protein [Glaciimonas sp. CA11.2]|uniref:tetratricopeptide repeat protein n=1 Tax=Glaciimonas sp. CA11.2 TaxID=3048601 RepID=UPI002AB34B2C|nr:tetratricopeptide repeat protein [Glaciimonas sp. CA11.2]MDY7547916.1 tetratricopeptide repeat protein [Glaciimonas sp. CA11.2]